MMRLACWLLKLYPASWRARYGEEFQAVLEQHRVTLRTLVNLVVCALWTRLTWDRPGVWLFRFFFGAAVLSGLSLAAYVGVQQPMRMAANHPQVEMAESLAQRLASGATVSGLPPATVDIQTSLHPFVIIYDASGRVVRTTGMLQGHVPPLPSGVFRYTRAHGEDRVTWQPSPGVRIAAVIVHFRGEQEGFVLAGRSLRQVELAEDRALVYAAEGDLAATCVLAAVLWAWRQRYKHRTV